MSDDPMAEVRIWDHYPTLANRYVSTTYGLRIRIMQLGDRLGTIALRTEVQNPSGEWVDSPGTLETSGFQSGEIMREVAKGILSLSGRPEVPQ